MTVELLKNMATISFIISAVMLVVTVVLFFVLKIPQVFGDLSGRTEKKAIENIRQMNSKENKHTIQQTQPDTGEIQRTGRTDKISPSGKIAKRTGRLLSGNRTAKINTELLTADGKNSKETTLLENESNETTFLENESNEITLLESEGNETTLLKNEENETTLLENEGNETTLLKNEENETMLLKNEGNETTILNAENNETTILNSQIGETSVISPEQTQDNTDIKEEYGLVYELTFMESKEIIA